MTCKHENAAEKYGEATHDSNGFIVYEAQHLECLDCGHWLSLGPSADTPETAIELRAAEIAAHRSAMERRLSSRFRTNYGEIAGWRGETTIDALHVVGESGEVRVDRDVPLNLESPSYLAGYLARAIATHEDE